MRGRFEVFINNIYNLPFLFSSFRNQGRSLYATGIFRLHLNAENSHWPSDLVIFWITGFEKKFLFNNVNLIFKNSSCSRCCLDKHGREIIIPLRNWVVDLSLWTQDIEQDRKGWDGGVNSVEGLSWVLGCNFSCQFRVEKEKANLRKLEGTLYLQMAWRHRQEMHLNRLHKLSLEIMSRVCSHIGQQFMIIFITSGILLCPFLFN